jgi:hypothetical protein
MRHGDTGLAVAQPENQQAALINWSTRHSSTRLLQHAGRGAASNGITAESNLFARSCDCGHIRLFRKLFLDNIIDCSRITHMVRYRHAEYCEVAVAPRCQLAPKQG